jgi:hypothetical protein
MRSKATTWRFMHFMAADKPLAAIAFLVRKLDDRRPPIRSIKVGPAALSRLQ